ncbi:MAG TPA: (d)CMP kinase [Planctomycetota bacterium]|nr:(d)CMP kinase [Planctomycetota bacterium]
MKKTVIITVDGPAGAGKSTIAKMLARQLAFHYLDTGALYRAVTWKALRNKILPEGNEPAIARLVLKSDIKLRHTFNGKGIKVLLDGRDISREIRTPEITSHIYKVSSLPRVRRAMAKLQRKLARGRNIVCEGRDMGSVVFPKAQIKFYLDASLKERAKRRYKESIALFPQARVGYNQVQKEISVRDYRDTHRKVAPLVKPKDAFYIDTTNLSIRRVVGILSRIISDKLDKKQ